MFFNSWLFVFFLCAFLPIYLILKTKQQNIALLIASYIFYSAWDYRFCLLLLSTTVVGFFCGKKIAKYSENSATVKLFLILSICFCLCSLCVFKYFGFFAFSLSQLFLNFGITLSPFTTNIILPVGISFYNFHVISYTVDIYRKQYVPNEKFSDMALFVAFFPLLVAGPIERAKHLLPQIVASRKITIREIKYGLWLIFWGLWKKVVVADNLSGIVNNNFESISALSSVEAYLTLVTFSIQIYCDFSGYTDIARGVSKLMGFDLLENFHFPYISVNPSDFWRRWHISLSSWLKDYLYIPLGGNRKGSIKTYLNLIITMLLGGLWHGAAWNFVVWGLYHGVLLAMHRFISKTIDIKINRYISIFLMYQLTLIGWMLFRCSSFGMQNGIWIDNSWQQIILFIHAFTKLPVINSNVISMMLYIVSFSAIIIVIELLQIKKNDIYIVPKLPKLQRAVICGILLFCLIRFGVQTGSAFIYFQF
jgi:alginate O-acetyltransferase complex protein AlgI